MLMVVATRRYLRTEHATSNVWRLRAHPAAYTEPSEISPASPVPSLAEPIAGGPLRGHWWFHPKSREIFATTRAVRAFLRDVLALPSVDAGGGWLI
jgi:hypothetical protein